MNPSPSAGFTLADLVAIKHNAANREDNRDGSDDNQSTNWGRRPDQRQGNFGARRAKRGLSLRSFSPMASR
jgi:pullulanase/glycogen debranching enzyme